MVATIAVLLIGNGIVTAIQGISSEEGRADVGRVAGLFSPYSLYRGVAYRFADGREPLAPPTGTGLEAAYVLVFLAISVLCVAGLLWRYRKVAAG